MSRVLLISHPSLCPSSMNPPRRSPRSRAAGCPTRRAARLCRRLASQLQFVRFVRQRSATHMRLASPRLTSMAVFARPPCQAQAEILVQKLARRALRQQGLAYASSRLLTGATEENNLQRTCGRRVECEQLQSALLLLASRGREVAVRYLTSTRGPYPPSAANSACAHHCLSLRALRLHQEGRVRLTARLEAGFDARQAFIAASSDLPTVVGYQNAVEAPTHAFREGCLLPIAAIIGGYNETLSHLQGRGILSTCTMTDRTIPPALCHSRIAVRDPALLFIFPLPTDHLAIMVQPPSLIRRSASP
ncbi:hypothetical protein FA95DRAFT_1045592 [Auriscalpium vulgare]|uniref:Uncharacterized protein n=1 Tax=Auriscalpium vulgare TaxID=40419 RepID=A0ACB8SAJ1_9AGAM|nr:hypothetical protein FA95DRAFT_1045592 [Auriscalpium vulgare]